MRLTAGADERRPVRDHKFSLDQLRQELRPQRITVASLPADLKRAWLAPEGRARVEALPKGDPDDTAALRQFVTAVLAVEPAATGPAVLMYEAGNTVVRAFVEAGTSRWRQLPYCCGSPCGGFPMSF